MTARNTHKFELRMGRLGLVLFILGMSTLLFAIFLFGVTVGKNIDTYPDKIARFIPDTVRSRTGWPSGPRETIISSKEEKKAEAAGPEKDMDLTFYDTLAKKKGDVGGLIIETPKGKRAEPDGDGEPPPAAKPKITAENSVTANPQKSAALPPVTAPAAAQKLAPAVAKEKFLIQVVSYQKKSKADELTGKLKSLGYASRIEVTELPDKGKWFRVIMDGFQSRPEAQKAADKVSTSIKGLNCVIRAAEGKGSP